MYIPKLYDGRNKTFFLVNYEGWRIGTGTNDYFFNVPPPSWVHGDFSQSGLKTVAQGCVPGPSQFCMPTDPTTGLAISWKHHPNQPFLQDGDR